MKGKTILVAGGSGGLGAPLCAFLRGQGAYVLSPAHADMDVTDPASVMRAVDAAGRIDVLLYAVGVSRSAMAWKVSDADWETTLCSNLRGAFHCMRAVLPGMRQRGWGRIVTLSSVVGHVGVAGTAAYSASKAGLAGLTRAAAVEVAKKGITVNTLALGYFDAGIIRDVPDTKPLLDTIPMGRLGREEDLCGVIGFLCSNASSYITGQTLHVNGGLFA
jgi:3-oxoacyl-[acyl-carrier protein] reductase